MKKVFLLLFFVASSLIAEMSVFREPGAAYLADLFHKPLRLKVLKPAPIYFDAPMTRSLGVLQEGNPSKFRPSSTTTSASSAKPARAKSPAGCPRRIWSRSTRISSSK